jgi:hypothetical protein
MPAPLVGLAIGAAARAVAKKAVKEAAKKETVKAAAKAKAKTAKIASNSVKVKAPDKSTPESVRIARNKEATAMAARRKSGELAQTTASRVNTKGGIALTSANPTGKANVVKINSGKTKPSTKKTGKK